MEPPFKKPKLGPPAEAIKPAERPPDPEDFFAMWRRNDPGTLGDGIYSPPLLRSVRRMFKWRVVSPDCPLRPCLPFAQHIPDSSEVEDEDPVHAWVVTPQLFLPGEEPRFAVRDYEFTGTDEI